MLALIIYLKEKKYMSPNKLQRLIDLVKKTGDRLVVHDSDTDNDVVIMDVDMYERLVNKALDVSVSERYESPARKYDPAYTNDTLPDEPFIHRDAQDRAEEPSSAPHRHAHKTVDLGGISFTSTQTIEQMKKDTDEEPQYEPISPEPIVNELEQEEHPPQIDDEDDDPVFFEEPV